MNMPILVIAFLSFSLLLTGSSWWLFKEWQRQQRFQARMLMIQGAGAAQKKAIGADDLRKTALRLISSLGQLILGSGIVPAKTRAELETTLAASGLKGAQGIAVFVGAKIALMAGLPVVAWFVSGSLPVSPAIQRLLPLLAAMLGLMAPDHIIARRRKKYVKRLEAGVPDTLDMLVICTQAGLSLGPAILRVAAELRMAYPEAAAELETTASEMQLLSDSRMAIAQLGTRTGLESLKRLAATLIQSLQYGTPVSEALRVLSAELRQQMLNSCEARAAKLPVMLTLPTIGFILPCVFLVAGGPAVIMLLRAFSH